MASAIRCAEECQNMCLASSSSQGRMVPSVKAIVNIFLPSINSQPAKILLFFYLCAD